MANTKSAAKRARQMAGRTLRNRSVLTRLRGMQKRSTSAQPDAKESNEFISAVDKAAKRGIIHKNTARRRKARLYKRMQAAQKPAA
jgi:small subunit ribosomal protein S20